MKIWRFYKKPSDKNDIKKRYDLYAITNKKEYALYFMKTRNMDMFYTRCTKEDIETYKKIANDNRDCVLDEFSLVTRDVNNNGLIISTRISMIITYYEYQCINGDEYQCDITGDSTWWNDIPDYSSYKKKIIKALRVLEYVSNYKLYAYQYQNNLFLEKRDDDYSAPNIWIDELGALISTFKITFK